MLITRDMPFLPPVALAILLRSSFLHLRTAIAPASTKYFMQRSSIPPVVRMTLAPAARIFSILSFVMSASLSVGEIRREGKGAEGGGGGRWGRERRRKRRGGGGGGGGGGGRGEREKEGGGRRRERRGRGGG